MRSDAEAYIVLDVSRSMLAAEEDGAPTRLLRARRAAARVRGDLADVPSGSHRSATACSRTSSRR